VGRAGHDGEETLQPLDHRTLRDRTAAQHLQDEPLLFSTEARG
jgi:hypothetical protein